MRTNGPDLDAIVDFVRALVGQLAHVDPRVSASAATGAGQPAQVDQFSLIHPPSLGDTLDALAASLGARAATLVLGETAADSVVWTPAIKPMVQEYFSDWVGRDPREARVQPALGAGFAVDQDYFTPGQIARDPYYQDFLRPHGLGWAASCSLADVPAPLVLSLKRELDEGPFALEHVQRGDLALPLLRRGAMLATDAWRAALRGQLQWLDRMQRGAIVLDRQARVLEFNDTALGDLGVRIVGGRLRAHFPAEAQRLDACIAATLADRSPIPVPHTLLLHSAQGARPVLAECASLRTLQPGLPGTAAIVVVLRNLDAEPAQEQRHAALRTLFGLSPRDATLCLLLAEGLPMSECAARAGISVDHARQRAKRIYARTSMRGHAALAALVARL